MARAGRGAMAALGARAGLLAACLCAGAAGAAPAVDKVQVDPATGLLRDAHGRARIFHGVNVVYKQAPWYPPSANFTPDDSLDGQTMDLLRKWGFNVVRLGVMWPGVEPSPGVIDQAYLDEILRLAGELAKRGVYTLADLHQDVGSRHFCGEGFPEHYVEALESDPSSEVSRAPQWPKPLSYPFSGNGTVPPPLDECLQHEFATYYLTDRVGALWDVLYTQGSALNAGFVGFWKAVASRMQGLPHILAYELLNEPSGFCLGGAALSCTDVPGVLVSNEVEATRLTPLYQAAATAIRTVDAATPIFYEATTLPKFTDAFPAPALGSDPQQGLAYHIYCQPGDGKGPIEAATCLAAQDVYSHLYYSFLRKHRGIGGFMTEFGAVGGSPGELRHLQRLLGFADGELQSWAYWMLKKYHDFTTANAAQSLYDEDGTLETAKLKALSRTYAQAVAGTPTRMSFNPDTGAFELAFNATVVDAPTEIYLNEELNYPDGFTATVSPPSCLEQRQDEPNYLTFSLAPSAACRGAVVTVQIARKAAPVIV